MADLDSALRDLPTEFFCSFLRTPDERGLEAFEAFVESGSRKLAELLGRGTFSSMLLVAVRDAIADAITTLPEQLRRSLTWDQGAEMAQHVQLRIDTGRAPIRQRSDGRTCRALALVSRDEGLCRKLRHPA